MKLLLQGEVIIDLATQIDLDYSDGIKLVKQNGDSVIYSFDSNLMVINVKEVPATVRAQEYCYSETNGFYKNPDYTPYIPPELEIVQLKEKQALMQAALDELIFGGSL